MSDHKKIFHRQDIPCADYLMSFADALREEFLAYHSDYLDGTFSKKQPSNPEYGSAGIQNRPDIWGITGVKYVFKHRADLMDPQIRRHFPTAIKLTNEYHPDCPISLYSSIEPGGIIHRHTGPENRDGEYIRVHIPLIIPDGDAFLEVGGKVVRWDDIFAFDNQTVHSAYNFTDKRRLVFIIDIRRSRIGLPPGRTWDQARDELAYPPFDPEPYRRK